MRIAFVTPAYYPAIIGASIYCQTLAEGLNKYGYNVDIYTNAPPSLVEKETVNGISVRRFYPRIVGGYYISSGMLGALLKKRYDIIHSHHFGYYPATAGFLAAKLTKTKHVFGPYYHPPIYGTKRRLMFSLYHVTQGLPVLRFSDKVLPHTNFEKKLLAQVGAKNSNMELLPNAVDTKRYKPAKAKKEATVLFVGNFISEKGAHIAFDMAESLIVERNARFVFIGNPMDGRLLGRIENLKQNKNAVFLKNMPEAELIKWYSRAAVIIAPSIYEAFGKAVAEAQSCGTPAVVTNVGGFPEVVQDGKTGFLVNYGDWPYMKERIEWLLDNPLKAKRMGLQGRKHVVENFDTKTVVKRLATIYEGLC